MSEQIDRRMASPFGEAMRRRGPRVGARSRFGGPAGQIAVMHRILVEEKRWIGENRFLQALNYCMLLPGPEAQQLAIYIGWLLHKTKGGLVAGTLFVLPGLVAIMALSWIYVLLGKVDDRRRACSSGSRPPCSSIVLEAVLRVGRRALKNNVMVALAAVAFVAIFFFDVPFPDHRPRRPASSASSAGAPAWPPFLAGGGHGKVGRQAGRRRRFALGEETPDACPAQPALVAHASPRSSWRCGWCRWPCC